MRRLIESHQEILLTVDNNLEMALKVYAYDIDLDNDIDIIPSTEANFVLWYENPLGSAHAVSLNASPTLVKPQSDPHTITAVLDNPDNSPVHVYAVIQGDQSGFVDTLQLYDDGLHGDSLAQDNLWVNTRITTDLSEDAYKVDIITYDSSRNDTLGFNPPARFFTLGPNEFESYSIDPDFFCNKTEPEPGGCLNLNLTLKNYSPM